jgi:hypothetical protein
VVSAPTIAAVSLEVLAVELRHVREQMDRLLVLAERGATKDEVGSLEKRVRVLEDDRTERRAIIALIAGAVGLIGIPGLILVAKAFLSQP